jgi:class 3 adenylate cyclase/tetratricopeptide (TPR) repeat protein
MLEWLENLGLAQYATLFDAHGIDLAALALVSDSELQDLGVLLGHRKKILSAITISAGPPAAAPAIAAASPATLLPAKAGLGERRQLTVLFCDMVGFTELANRVDPEVLQDIIRTYEDVCAVCIARYEGYVFQRLGDGIVSFFGYPLAHEEEAERAIHAGLSIIEKLAKLQVPEVGQLQVRIGIATGVVVVSSAEKGAVGETMNLASRLQGIAPVGCIVVSERVHRLAGGSFEYQDLGEQTLKGIVRPARAYRIVGVSQAASRFEAANQSELTPLVGRDAEFELLLKHWQLAQEGKGQVVLLSGEPGIGKSRVLSALLQRLESQGAQAVRFQSSPYHVNSAFWPSIDNFERALMFGRDESPDSKLDKLEALIVNRCSRPLADVRFVASMLSIPCEQRYGAISMTPHKYKDETLRALVDLSEAAAIKQSTVMLFEDAHWADPTSLEVLDLLIDRVRDIPLFIVLTHRPEFQSRWAHHGHVTGLNLSRLTREQSSAMVSGVVGAKALPAELLARILAKTDGVPLFVEELTKSILESGELKDAGDRYEYVGSAHSITIPATLRDSLMARLDRFMPVKEIAQIGAAIGREFSHELLATVAPMNQAALDDGLERLTESGLAHRRGTPPQAVYTFKHALVQDAAYDSLLKSRRQELHGKIAHAIEANFPGIKTTEPEVLAHHLSTAGLTEAAIPLWLSAGERALKRMALSEAISHLDKGLELVATLPASSMRDASELGLRSLLGPAWTALRGWATPQVWTSLHPARALAKSLDRSDALVPIIWGLWVNVLTQGRVAESLPWAQEMLDIAKVSGNSDLLITGHTIACTCYYWMGDFSKVLEHGEKVHALYEDSKHSHLVDFTNNDPKTAAGGYIANATWMLGYPDRAVRLNDEMLTHARQRAHAFDLGWATSTGADVFSFRREPKVLRKRAEECERLGRENSMPVLWAMLAPRTYGLVLMPEGSFAECIATLEGALAIWEATGGKIDSPRLKAFQAEAMAALGDLEGALQVIALVIEQVERPGWQERYYFAEILRLKGWMLFLKGDLEGAEQSYVASLNCARQQQAKSLELRTSTSLARLMQGQGKRRQARDLLQPVYDWFTEGFDTLDLQEARTLLDSLNG